MSTDQTCTPEELTSVQRQLAMTANDPNLTIVTSSPVYECFLCQDSKKGCTETCERVAKYRKGRNVAVV